MANTKSNALFSLINSLSKSDKRHFKLFASKYGDANDMKFVRLFDLIEKQKEFDEERILEKDPSLKAEQLSNLKAHLYNHILQVLRQLQAAKDMDMTIRSYIDNAQILYNKCLYEQCEKMLRKAKKLAIKSENLSLLLDILKWEKNILTHTIKTGSHRRVNKIIEETDQVNKQISHINAYSNLIAKLNAFYQNMGFIKNEKDYKKAHDYFFKYLPQTKEEDLGFDEQMYLFNAYIGYYFFIQDFENALEYALKWVALFDQQPDMIPVRLEMYIKGLNSLLIAQWKLLRYDAFTETQTRLNALTSQPDITITENVRLILFKYYYAHEINRRFMLGDFSGGIRMIKDMDMDINQFIDRLDNHYRIIFYYKISCLYFGDSQFHDAVRWLHKIINLKDVDLREDIHSFARIMNLISHYEIGNTDLIEYYIKSLYHFLLKKEDLHQYQKSILSFLKALTRYPDETELLEEFRKLRERLIPLTRTTYEKRAFIYFDIISWLDSKLDSNGRTVQTIIRQKAAKRIGKQYPKELLAD